MKYFARYFSAFCFLFISLHANAQRHMDNWYFGRNIAFNFPGGAPPGSVPYSMMNSLNVATCISDPSTGQLLFYSDGKTVWNRNHVVMPGGNLNNLTCSDALIIPDPGSSSKYYLVVVCSNHVMLYYTIDMAYDGGLGQVTGNGSFNMFASIFGNKITAAKHGTENSYWLVTHSWPASNKFLAYKISATGISATPVESTAGTATDLYGELAFDNTGNKLAATHYSSNNGIVEVFDFNKICGKVHSPVILPKQPGWDYSYGISFSPNDKKLYISYSNQQSQLVQYEVGNYANNGVIATNDRDINTLLLGPDNRIYAATFDISPLRLRVDVVENPDNAGNNIVYTPNFINIGVNTIGPYEFPNFIMDRSAPGPPPQNSILSIDSLNTCLGDSTKFGFTASFIPDSVQWDFGDTASITDVSKLFKASYLYKTEGTYTVSLNWFSCGLPTTQKKVITLAAINVDLGADTAFCYEDTVTLSAKTGRGIYEWNTGDKTEAITVTQSGKYWVKVTDGRCADSDTITIKQLPPVLVELGGNYAICDDDNELVKLDAGKGHDEYLWKPTGDTTQWIIVNKVGDYYVIVEDFRGCKGEDGSTVHRFCDFSFFLPNAFTPNDDRLNDVFSPVFSDVYNYTLEIYNRWGEQVFVSDDPAKGWDGTYKDRACAMDSYTWKVQFKGNQNKILRNYNYDGTLFLAR